MYTEKHESLPEELLLDLASRCPVRDFARGEQLFAEGEASDCLYVLVSGEVKVFTRDDKGRELVYNTLQPGALFGELFLDGDPRSASVRAIAAGRCIEVGEAMVHELIRSHPAFAEFLIMKLIARVRHATDFSKRLAMSGVFARTVDLLEEVAVPIGDARVVPASFTQQEIASRVGATREMVNHVIGDLVRGGFVARDAKRRLTLLGTLPRR